MKSAFVIVSLIVLPAAALNGQSPGTAGPAVATPPAILDPGGPDPAWQATGQLKEKYRLDAAQEAKMYAIQQRKQRNLAEIEPLKDNPALYNAKLQSLQRGTQASIRRLLLTEAQQALFRETQSEQRKKRGLRRQELAAQGASQLAIESAMLEIYLE